MSLDRIGIPSKPKTLKEMVDEVVEWFKKQMKGG